MEGICSAGDLIFVPTGAVLQPRGGIYSATWSLQATVRFLILLFARSNFVVAACRVVASGGEFGGDPCGDAKLCIAPEFAEGPEAPGFPAPYLWLRHRDPGVAANTLC